MDTLTIVLIGLSLFVIVFLILREVNCWYWKINKRIELQEMNNKLLREILAVLKNEPVIEEEKTIQGKSNFPDDGIPRNIYGQPV
jgi:hypothetical protein